MASDAALRGARDGCRGSCRAHGTHESPSQCLACRDRKKAGGGGASSRVPGHAGWRWNEYADVVAGMRD